MNLRPEWTLCGCAYALVIGVALAVSGCATTGPDDRTALDFATKSARNAQLGITTLIAVDTAQTVTIARNPDCLYEGNKLAANIFGDDTPSQSRVLITNALYIAGHWAFASYLDRKIAAPVDLSIDAETDLNRRQGWRIVRGIYQALTFLGHGAAVASNANQGIRPASNYNCKE